ncbi:hypothetical protein ACA910_018878 [Epithemia clementina (nom. ined.)]
MTAVVTTPKSPKLASESKGGKMLLLRPAKILLVAILVLSAVAQIQHTLTRATNPTTNNEHRRRTLAVENEQSELQQNNQATTLTKDSQQQHHQQELQRPHSTTMRRRGLSQTAMNSWCPNAQCHVTDLCHPCRRRYLIILATGRSGSTTLQEMLHSLPGVRMSGENNGMLAQFQFAIDETRKKDEWQRARANKPGAWRHNPVPKQSFACVIQQMIETINPPKFNSEGHVVETTSDNPNNVEEEDETIIGFKSIRFPPQFNATVMNDETLKRRLLREAAAFLNENLPCAKFVISIRDAESHAQSIRKAFKDHDSQSEWESARHNQELLDFSKLLGGPSRVHVMDSSQWTQNLTLVNDMVSTFLGFETACHFDRLFELNTQLYRPGDVTSRDKVPQGCRKMPF